MGLFLYIVERIYSNIIRLICMQLPNFPNTTYRGNCLFLSVYSCFFCQKLIDDNCVSFWFLYFFFHCWMSLFVAIPLLGFVMLSEVWDHYTSSFVLSLHNCLGILVFYVTFWILGLFVVVPWGRSWIIWWDGIKPADCFE